MSYNYTLRYRTFDQLIDDISSDFPKYDLEEAIRPEQLIKVARRVNYELGLRVFKTREMVLEVEKGRVKLPDNFYTLNFALMCGEYETKQYMPQGTHIEERPIDAVAPTYQVAPPEVIPVCEQEPQPVDPPTDPCDPCNNQDACSPAVPKNCQLNCKGDKYELVQILKSQTRTYKFLRPLRMLENAMDIDCDCPNLYWESPMTAWIKDGWLYTNFKEGNVYINYQSMMEDDEGNLLVVDHELINEYYEYALKQRIIENLIMNGEVVNQAQIQLIEKGLREYRNKAKSLVNTPNFSELKKLWQKNRKAQYHKYYDMFKSYPWLQGNYNAFYNRTKLH